MSMTGIILAAVVVGGTGLFIGVFLGIAGKKFAVKVDEREEAILGVLPGNNCGGCGYAGCSGLAAAIVKGEAEVGGCPVGGAPVAAKIGDIMGVAAGTQERQTAFVKCAGTCEKAILDYDYTGIQDCTMASMMQNGGAKGCNSGCLGFGSCVAACPKHLIELIPYEQKTFVRCNSNAKGKVQLAICQAGCIGCRICEKNCEAGAITVTNFLAHIDADKCTECGVCVEKCPRKIITLR